MTTEQKAKELVNKYYHSMNPDAPDCSISYEQAKQCALICIDKLIEQNGELYLNGLDGDYYRAKNAELFDIKQEIEKL